MTELKRLVEQLDSAKREIGERQQELDELKVEHARLSKKLEKPTTAKFERWIV